MNWNQVKTIDQKERLTQSVLDEIEKLRKSPALKGIISNLVLGQKEWAEGGWCNVLKIDRNGKLLDCYCGRDYDAHKVSGEKLEYLISWMEITPEVVIKARKEIEA